MSIIIPGTKHAITWQKQNMLDESTYFVQAIIRDLKTNAILATINLTDVGNGRFIGYWHVVQDSTGRGREIEIEKTVYEDSGYSQISGMYGRWLDRYMIYELKPLGGTGGGFTQNIDLKQIESIFERKTGSLIDQVKSLINTGNKESFEKILSQLDFDSQKNTVFDKLKYLFKVKRKIENIEQIESRILETSNDVIEKSKQTSEDIHLMIQSGKEELQEVLNEATEKLKNAVEVFEEKTTLKNDKELEYFINKFKLIAEVLENKVKKINFIQQKESPKFPLFEEKKSSSRRSRIIKRLSLNSRKS